MPKGIYKRKPLKEIHKKRIRESVLRYYKNNPEYFQSVKDRFSRVISLGLKVRWPDDYVRVTPLWKRIRNSQIYKDWRNNIFERDNWTCQKCGERGGNLQADHIKPFAYYPELRFELSNGRTLCIECHKNTPTYLKKNPSPMDNG